MLFQNHMSITRCSTSWYNRCIHSNTFNTYCWLSRVCAAWQLLNGHTVFIFAAWLKKIGTTWYLAAQNKSHLLHAQMLSLHFTHLANACILVVCFRFLLSAYMHFEWVLISSQILWFCTHFLHEIPPATDHWNFSQWLLGWNT